MKKASSDEEAGRAVPADSAERSSVELAVAPHLPLLHHALLHDPADDAPATLHVSHASYIYLTATPDRQTFV